MSTERLSRLLALLEAEPDDAFTRYALAMEHAGLGEIEAAIGLLENLRNRHPDYVASYHQLGILFERQGETGRAEAAYREGITAAQRTGDAHAAGEMQDALDQLS